MKNGADSKVKWNTWSVKVTRCLILWIRIASSNMKYTWLSPALYSKAKLNGALPHCTVTQPVPSAVKWCSTPNKNHSRAKTHNVPSSFAEYPLASSVSWTQNPSCLASSTPTCTHAGHPSKLTVSRTNLFQGPRAYKQVGYLCTASASDTHIRPRKRDTVCTSCWQKHHHVSVLATRTARGKGAAKKTRMAWYACTCPKADTCRATAKSIWAWLRKRSTIDRAMVWEYDRHSRFIKSCSWIPRNA